MRKPRGKLKKGLDYEAAFAEAMEDRFEELYVAGPWFRYKEIGKEKTKWCQPDGLLFLPLQRTIVIVETKLRHTSDAWWQLKHLYLPIVSHLFPPNLWNYTTVEVVRWFEKGLPYPEKIRMCPDILTPQPGEFGVHIWLPK